MDRPLAKGDRIVLSERGKGLYPRTPNRTGEVVSILRNDMVRVQWDNKGSPDSLKAVFIQREEQT